MSNTQRWEKDVLLRIVSIIFAGDVDKANLWFVTKNPMLGGLSPQDMIYMGSYDRLVNFIVDAVSKTDSNAQAAINAVIDWNSNSQPENENVV